MRKNADDVYAEFCFLTREHGFTYNFLHVIREPMVLENFVFNC